MVDFPPQGSGGGGTGGATSLAGLSDVSLSNLAIDQILKFNGALWVNGIASSLPITSTNIDILLDTTYYTVKVDASNGNRIITLPTSFGMQGKIYNIKKMDATVNIVTIACSGGEVIDGSPTVIISAQYTTITVQSDNANWVIL